MTDEQQLQRILESQGMYKNNFSALYLTDNQIDFLIEYVHELKEAKETAVEALDEDQYEVVNPTSLFTGRIGRKEAAKIANEITLSFDGPRGRFLASFHPSEIKKV